MSQRIEGGGLQVVGKLAVDSFPSLLKARQTSPFVAFQGIPIVCLQRSDVGMLTLRLLASCLGELEEVQAQFELLFSGYVRPEGMSISHSDAPVDKTAIRVSLSGGLEHPARTCVSHVVQKRDTALHEALHGLFARDGKVYCAYIVAIIIHQPGGRHVRNEHKRNKEESYKDKSHPPFRQRKNSF